MSERKVLNKYYPPDFDPSKIPRARCPKNRKFAVRLMAPCNMKCLTCNEYIAQGKKFNARKEDVENLTYLGIRIYRFYIKCPGCLSEISFRTDPESTDYILEAGAHRNFQALRLAEAQAAKEEQEIKDEIKSNPMLLLENRTQQSQHEMEVLESLEDLTELNEARAGIDLGKMAQKYEEAKQLTKEQEEEALKMAALKALGYECIDGQMIKRVHRQDSSDDETEQTVKKSKIFEDPLSKGSISSSFKSKLAGAIKKKTVDNEKPKEAGNSKNGTKSALGLIGQYSDSESNESS